MKGGVGKTSLAINLAAGLARRAAAKKSSPVAKVLLLDMDKQGNSLKTVSGTTSYTDVESLTSAIADDELLDLLGVTRRPLIELVRQAPEPWSPNLYFVPFREITMVEMRRRMASIGNTKEMMRAAIDSLRSAFEYVVIDTAPDMDDLLFAIFSASDYVIVPVEMDNFALEGASRITEKVKNLGEATGKPQILGYLANKVVGRQIGDKNVLDGLASMFDSQVYQVSIPTSIDIRYSQAVGRDIYGYAPSSPIAAAMGEMVEETLRRIKSLPAKPRHARTG